jgi:hypothetical protein
MSQISPHARNVQPDVSFTLQSVDRRSRSWRFVNSFRTRPGMVYVAVLVLVVCSIPLMREAKRMHTLQTWPTDSAQPHRSFLG